jgi:hypothetical protein
VSADQFRILLTTPHALPKASAILARPANAFLGGTHRTGIFGASPFGASGTAVRSEHSSGLLNRRIAAGDRMCA